MPTHNREQLLHCPSAAPQSEGAALFGIVFHDGMHAEVRYLDQQVPVTHDILALTGDIPPSRVLRIAAPCAREQCVHFGNGNCKLVERVVERMDEQEDLLHACALRTNCRWFAQEGIAACRRCKHITTLNVHPNELLIEIAKPQEFHED